MWQATFCNNWQKVLQPFIAFTAFVLYSSLEQLGQKNGDSSGDLPTGASEEQNNKYMVFPGQIQQVLALQSFEG